MSEQTYYEYKRIKYELIAETLKKELENSKKPIDKSENVCYNKNVARG